MREFHFSRAELMRSKIAQEKGLPNDAPSELETNVCITLAGLERIRAFLDHPMKITSGYRSPEINLLVGGEGDSLHMKGQAADFVCEGYGPPEKIAAGLAKNIDILGIDQVILEPGWVHVSFTLTPRLQVLRRVGTGYVSGLISDVPRGTLPSKG